MWSYSINEENYSGPFDTQEHAVAEALELVKEGQSFWIGQNRPPIQPEVWWDAEDWLELCSCQDDYSLECASDWDRSTELQRKELETEVRRVMANWLDRHNLRPQFWLVEGAEKYVKDQGKAVRPSRVFNAKT